MSKKDSVVFQSPEGSVRLTENDVEQDADGGRIVLVADAPSLGNDFVEGEEKVSNITLVINYRRDDPMRKWPATREDRARRRFTVNVKEVVEAGEGA